MEEKNETGIGQTIYFHCYENGEPGEPRYHLWLLAEPFDETPRWQKELLEFDCEDLPSGFAVCEVFAQITKSKIDIFDGIKRLARMDAVTRKRTLKMKETIQRLRKKLKEYESTGRKKA